MDKVIAKATSRGGPEEFTVVLRKGQTLFREGDLGSEMYIVHEGRVEVLQNVGGRPRRLAVLEQGDFFGELSLLDDLPRSASVRALEDSRLLEINRSTFVDMLRSNPEIAVRMMRKLSWRLRQTDDLLRRAIGNDWPGTTLEVPLPTGPGPASLGPERLVHEASDTELLLSQEEVTTIGRHDPVTGIEPHIDLSPVDPERSSSRRHARIRRDAEGFWLSEEVGVMNGTFVNGLRLQTAVARQIQPEDRLSFGRVELVFRVG